MNRWDAGRRLPYSVSIATLWIVACRTGWRRGGADSGIGQTLVGLGMRIREVDRPLEPASRDAHSQGSDARRAQGIPEGVESLRTGKSGRIVMRRGGLLIGSM